MKINCWNEKKQCYEKKEVPDHYKIRAYSDDMDEVISCVNCGMKITYGSGYTSRRWHTEGGIGYMECADCYFNYDH